MATVKDKVSTRLVRNLTQGLPVWADIQAAWSGLNQGQQNKIRAALHAGNIEGVGRVISAAYIQVIQTKANTEADTLLANGTLDESELSRIL